MLETLWRGSLGAESRGQDGLNARRQVAAVEGIGRRQEVGKNFSHDQLVPSRHGRVHRGGQAYGVHCSLQVRLQALRIVVSRAVCSRWLAGAPLLYISGAMASLGDALFGYSQGVTAAFQVQPNFIYRTSDIFGLLHHFRQTRTLRTCSCGQAQEFNLVVV